MRPDGSTEIEADICRHAERQETPAWPVPAGGSGSDPRSAISILLQREQFGCLLRDPVNIWASPWASARTWKGLNAALGKVGLTSLSWWKSRALKRLPEFIRDNAT